MKGKYKFIIHFSIVNC